MKRVVDAREHSTFDAKTVGVEEEEIKVANAALNWPRKEVEPGQKRGGRGGKGGQRQKSHYKARVLPMQLDSGWLETVTQCAPDLHDPSLGVLLSGANDRGYGRRGRQAFGVPSLTAQPVVRSTHTRYCPPPF
jgi:hypothetical protein